MKKIKDVIKRTYYIRDFKKWDETVYKKSMMFYRKYNVYPNILQASIETLDKIDKVANPENLQTEDRQRELFYLDEDIKTVTNFETSNFKLDFCINEQLKRHRFILIYDREPIYNDDHNGFGSAQPTLI